MQRNCMYFFGHNSNGSLQVQLMRLIKLWHEGFRIDSKSFIHTHFSEWICLCFKSLKMVFGFCNIDALCIIVDILVLLYSFITNLEYFGSKICFQIVIISMLQIVFYSLKRNLSKLLHAFEKNWFRTIWIISNTLISCKNRYSDKKSIYLINISVGKKSLYYLLWYYNLIPIKKVVDVFKY